MTSEFSFAALLSTLLVSLLIVVPYSAVAGDANSPASDFPATDLIIFSADGNHVIGHGRYTISRTDDTEILRGENQYLDGEHDVELERLKLGVGAQAPTLVSYEHSFFNANGSPQIVDSLDVKHGSASCKSYTEGNFEDHQSNLAVPADTYAGATQIMFVVVGLRQGAHEIKFHAFNCMPRPRIIAVEALAGADRVRWSMYPGELVKLEIQPDFGWFGILVAPFVRKMDAWFDPRDNWNYVGGLYDRFYKGPHILTVRAFQPFRQRD